ncbi:MAG: anhydro-N-acetylmuramic acid kinase, partial [Rickettsiales bacterium]|nr:anhydro-N-acetylmuramic acid kinase [Rickettsiales bacterium]
MLTAIGLMSGTSLDGIDAAILRTDGVHVEVTPHHLVRPYDAAFSGKLSQAIRTRAVTSGLERELTLRHADAVQELLQQTGIPASNIDVIGFHGQTIFHAPEEAKTWQIGDGPLLAERTGIPVVYDFRSADILAGGQGAPLAPLYHDAIMRVQSANPVAVLNIGGVANVTYIRRHAGGSEMLACDTGPGNALLNDWMLHHTGEPCDWNGTCAAKGKVHKDVILQFFRHAYFRKPPPKSLDRNAFSLGMLEGLSAEDGAATLAAITVQSVVLAARYFPEPPEAWYVVGGGRYNQTMMDSLNYYF